MNRRVDGELVVAAGRARPAEQMRSFVGWVGAGQRWGYVEPTEAAWELLEETVGSYEREIERLLALGMIGSAVETALGLIAGLYRCQGCEDGDLLLSWAPDFPIEQAGVAVDKLAGARVEIPPELLADIAPEWEASLTNRKRLRA